MPEEYDNRGKGAVWPTKAMSGKAEDAVGNIYYIDVVKTSVDSPSHRIYFKAIKGDCMSHGVLFRDKPDVNRFASGEIKLLDMVYRVALFANKSEKENSPTLDIVLSEQEAGNGEGYTPERTPEGDDIPF